MHLCVCVRACEKIMKNPNFKTKSTFHYVDFELFQNKYRKAVIAGMSKLKTGIATDTYLSHSVFENGFSLSPLQYISKAWILCPFTMGLPTVEWTRKQGDVHGSSQYLWVGVPLQSSGVVQHGLLYQLPCVGQSPHLQQTNSSFKNGFKNRVRNGTHLLSYCPTPTVKKHKVLYVRD